MTHGSRTAELWLVRHGETEWSRDGRHTSTTDLDLTESGVEVAARPARSGWPASRLRPGADQPAAPRPSYGGAGRVRRRRTSTTTSSSGTTATTRASPPPRSARRVPGWTVWTHPTPGGETAEQVTARLDRVVARVRASGGRVLVFGHGHSLRALAARWIEQPVDEGRFFKLDTATVSTLGYERDFPVVLRWNS